MNTELSTNPPAALDNTVSWQSAFWALVPIALNSVAQPSGKVQGYSSHHAYLWKISPIVCMLDAIYLLIDLTRVTLKNRSLRAAARYVSRKRFHDITPESERNSIGKLQDNAAFRTCVFCFGVIPQVIKLYSMSGVPWTQVWGSLFLGSFLMTEPIINLLRRYSSADTTEPIPDKLECFIGVVTVNSSFTLSAWALLYSLLCKINQTEAIDGKISIGIGVACAILVHLGVFVKSRHPYEQALLLGSSFVAFVSVGFLWQRLNDLLRPIQVIVGMVHTLLVQISCWALMLSLPKFRCPSADTLIDEAQNSQLGFGLYFSLLHVVAAVAFYVFGYSAVGTYKPSWSNQLG